MILLFRNLNSKLIAQHYGALNTCQALLGVRCCFFSGRAHHSPFLHRAEGEPKHLPEVSGLERGRVGVLTQPVPFQSAGSKPLLLTH